ncbi:hypothetical protein BGZ54_000754 [Gamsiella multidivaricata]|nr:hypothetical protein BGZ54_000754 [Gamsiella multidivaricata]
MAAQTRCLMDGLRPCRRRDNIRKRKTQRQYQISSHMRENKDGATSATSRAEYDEETAMDEIWRRHQQQRTERSEVQDSVPVFNHGSGTGDQVAERKVEGDSACGSKLDRSLEELAGERLWEFVVGWCLIGCIFAGAALIVGANLKAQDGLSNEAPWTFNTEEGDSLMDSVVAHVMKIALGIKDFGDQLMEHGIFIFVTGINGFVLVRQRVYVRRRDYEADILQEDTPTTIIPNKQNEHETRETIERCNILSSGSHENLKGADDFYDYSGPIYPGEYLFQHERPECAQSVDNSTKEQHQERKKDNGDDENGDNDADCSPEFRSMSFLAWFNYLQVGILVIEFLQLFSFPLRELMEFYNQAEKTNDMYESAEVVLNVFRDATASTGQDAPANFSRLHYHDGMLSLGNSTIFSFTLHNSNDTTRTSRIVGNDSTPRSSEGSTRTFGQQQLFDWWQNMPLLDNATALAAPWIKNISISTDWIADNLPVWLPNITALMTNSSLASLAQSDLENIRNRLVNTAAGLISHGLSVPGSNTTNTTSSIGSLPTEDGSLKTYPPREDMAGDGDIVMQVVNSLGLQPSINTHDWGLVSMAVMLAMACYTIRMKPCYWNKVNYWRTFSFSCVLYASLLVALLCPSPEPNKVKGERIGGKWVMAPNLKMGHAWTVGGGPKVMLSWIVAGWALLIIVFVVADKVFLWHWAKKKKTNKRVASDTVGSRSEEGPRPGFDFRQEQQGIRELQLL